MKYNYLTVQISYLIFFLIFSSRLIKNWVTTEGRLVELSWVGSGAVITPKTQLNSTGQTYKMFRTARSSWVELSWVESGRKRDHSARSDSTQLNSTSWVELSWVGSGAVITLTTRFNSTQLNSTGSGSSEHFVCLSSWVELSFRSDHSARSDSTQLNQAAFSRDPVFNKSGRKN